ncbi:unnamed protein product [Brassicogethes aeneus]|uniref:Uncharacterized protein n=1 Tax=Brassicogethes aeneus TaxID=1431903 RepID=A0A9P0BH68_BRAAE|nr:unnamed protein product [Brassicogethes aeneus]
MKDENNGVPMTDYVGLKSKLYSTKVLQTEEDVTKNRKKMQDAKYDDEEIDAEIKNMVITKKAKGVKSSILKTEITFEDYDECLDSFKQKIVSQHLIRSEKHQVHSIIQQKIGLSYEDDKRYLISGTDNTLPWGHNAIPSTSSKKKDGCRCSH